MSSSAFGEVLTSTITGFTAQAWTEDGDFSGVAKLPSFGSFIKAVSEEKSLSVYAIVHNIITGSVDQHHKPAALRMTRKELRREQPQIFALLKTEIYATIVGYKQHEKCVSSLPPSPPEVHDFVYFASKEELRELTKRLDFLRILQNTPGVPMDELLAASIRLAAKEQEDEYTFLVSAGQQISRLFRDDYDRLGSILNKIRP